MFSLMNFFGGWAKIAKYEMVLNLLSWSILSSIPIRVAFFANIPFRGDMQIYPTRSHFKSRLTHKSIRESIQNAL
jgi:hypothetical protein